MLVFINVQVKLKIAPIIRKMKKLVFTQFFFQCYSVIFDQMIHGDRGDFSHVAFQNKLNSASWKCVHLWKPTPRIYGYTDILL